MYNNPSKTNETKKKKQKKKLRKKTESSVHNCNINYILSTTKCN